MNTSTVAFQYYLNTIIPLGYNEADSLTKITGSREYFSIIFISKGNGIVNLNGKLISFIVPGIFCLNEKDEFSIVNCPDINVQYLNFEPSF